VTKIDAEANALSLANGQSVNYDYLVITTGPKLAFEEVPGLGPQSGHTQSVCTLTHAEESLQNFKALLESALRSRHIKWITNAKVSRVEDGMMYVDEHNDAGEVVRQHELPFNRDVEVAR